MSCSPCAPGRTSAIARWAPPVEDDEIDRVGDMGTGCWAVACALSAHGHGRLHEGEPFVAVEGREWCGSTASNVAASNKCDAWSRCSCGSAIFV